MVEVVTKDGGQSTAEVVGQDPGVEERSLKPSEKETIDEGTQIVLITI